MWLDLAFLETSLSYTGASRRLLKRAGVSSRYFGTKNLEFSLDSGHCSGCCPGFSWRTSLATVFQTLQSSSTLLKLFSSGQRLSSFFPLFISISRENYSPVRDQYV